MASGRARLFQPRHRAKRGANEPLHPPSVWVFFGGPIIKNKTFFFFNDEMDRFLTTLTNSASIPTQGFLDGNFEYTYLDTNFVQHSVPIDLVDTPGNGPGGGGITRR